MNLSPLQKARYEYSPKLPGMLRNGIAEIAVKEGEKRNMKDVDMVAKLFDEIAPKYADRNGGYTRIVKIGQRKGDAAMEVLIELV